MDSTDLDKSAAHTPITPSGSRPNGSEPEAGGSCCKEAGMSEHEVLSYIYETDGSENTDPACGPSISPFEDADCSSWQNAPNSKCHASFGDRGTTATVGAFGQLLQFGDYLGAGSSGMFSADHPSVQEPYLVTGRATELEELSQRPFHFGGAFSDGEQYGLKFPKLNLKSDAQPQLKWTHCRWPRHEYSEGDFENLPTLKLTMQWMIRDKVVLQQCILENCGEDSFDVDLAFSTSIHIRDLDHVDDDFDFNEEGSSNHDIGPGPEKFSSVCVHKFNTDPPAERPKTSDGSEGHLESEQSPHNDGHRLEKPYGISVISSIAIDNKVQSFDCNEWKLPVKGRQLSGGPHEIIIAYKMNLVTAPEPHWMTNIIQWKDMKVSKFLREQRPCRPLPLYVPAFFDKARSNNESTETDGGGTFSDPGAMILPNPEEPGTAPPEMKYIATNPTRDVPGSSSEMRHLGFAARRNLEHILSVCAIQVTSDASAVSYPEALRDVEAIALTCGDMSGHRICWSASFFAIRFLVKFHEVLRFQPKDYFVVSVLRRIRDTCLGHLKWLFLAQKQDNGQHFGANYWPSGRKIVKADSSGSWVATSSLLDTGFQILKAAACMELGACNDTAAELMSTWAPSWLLSMEKSDKRKKYAWPHAEYEGVNIFRLDEHVWIWRALKSLEENDRHAWKLMSEKVSGDAFTSLSKNDIARMRKSFASEVVQREVSKRFTTENDVFQKRMLAVTRSPRETRFLLHSRDTALFYNEMYDFLGKNTSIQELWNNTIDCQMYHEGYQESTWENPLRYALSIIMGTQGLRIDKRPPDEMLKTATDVIFRSSSGNGFFPGRIEPLKKTPVDVSFIAEEDRDFYYHVSFEIPYILLTHACQVSDIYVCIPDPNIEAADSTPNSNIRLRNDIPRQGPQSSRAYSQLHRSVSPVPVDAQEREILLNLSRFILSQSAIPYPDFNDVLGTARRAASQQRLVMKKVVPFNNLINSSSIVKVEDEWLFKYPDFFLREEGSENEESALETSSRQSWSGSISGWTHAFCMFDVKSSKLIEGKRKGDTFERSQGTNDNGLRHMLDPFRTVRDSKKRLVHFHTATKSYASICCATTEASARDAMIGFFERHEGYEKHAIDQCSMVHNTWDTELHLSYYQLIESSCDPQLGIPHLHAEKFPGDRRKQIVRASASFRFQGDFFDRYWTCYLLDYNQHGRISDCGLLKVKENQQRKVLEQQYFADILTSLTRSTAEILTEMKTCLGFTSGSFSTIIRTTSAYQSWDALWQEFEPLLHTLEDDLASTRVTVEQWEAREEERGEEKPRWTRNDERKYRASITKIRRDIKHQMNNLQHLHTSIKTLREACSNRLVRAREELSFRSEQNIATFTYVTVVFLPLGFTASIFSMSGSPERSLVINMVVASVIALAVTILALMNAKGLLSVTGSISTSFKDLTDDAKESSVLIRDRQDAKEKAITTKSGDPKPPHVRVSPTDAIPWDVVFWTGYLFIELPSRSITAACGALGWPRDNPQDMKGLIAAATREIAHGVRICLRSGEDTMNDPESDQRASEGPTADCVAQANIGANDQPHRDKNEYFQRIARVLLGLFTVPVFLPLWILQILCFYAWDTLALLGEFLRQGISHISLPDRDGFESHLMTRLTKPSETLRPLKRFKDHIRSKREELQVKARNNAGVGKETVSSSEVRIEWQKQR